MSEKSLVGKLYEDVKTLVGLAFGDEIPSGRIDLVVAQQARLRELVQTGGLFKPENQSEVVMLCAIYGCSLQQLVTRLVIADKTRLVIADKTESIGRGVPQQALPPTDPEAGGPSDPEARKRSSEFRARFWRDAQDVSIKELQDLYAHLLAGDLKRPGSVSFLTLDIVRRLERSDAELITRAGQARCTRRAFAPETAFEGIFGYEDVLRLVELGLVASTSSSTMAHTEPRGTWSNPPGTWRTFNSPLGHYVAVWSETPGENERSAERRRKQGDPVSPRILSSAGIELLSVVDIGPPDRSIRVRVAEWLKKELRSTAVGFLESGGDLSTAPAGLEWLAGNWG